MLTNVSYRVLIGTDHTHLLFLMVLLYMHTYYFEFLLYHSSSAVASESTATTAVATTSGQQPPEVQLLQLPSQLQLAALSVDRLLIGRVPQCATVTRMVVLRNALNNMPIEFNFNSFSGGYGASKSFLLESQLVTVTPSNGRIDPGSFIVLRVAVNATCAPVIINDVLPLYVREAVLHRPNTGRKVRVTLEPF
jgi:hypothetical protein